MLFNISGIRSKLKSAFLNPAMHRPTHFPAISTAMEAKEEPGPDDGTGEASKKDDPEH